MDPQRKALARKLVIGVVGLTGAMAIGFGLWNAIMNRPPKFARVVAEDLPADCFGMVAFSDISRTLELFDEAVPSDVRAEIEKELGFDPFEKSSYEDLGFDIEAPFGGGMTDDLERPVIVFTVGLTDADKARETITSYAEKFGIEGLEERKFEGVEGLWLAEQPTAFLFRDDRMIVVTSEFDEAKIVEDVAEDIAELRAGDSLASTDTFRNIQRFAGDPIVMMFGNTSELESSFMAAATIGSTDVEGMALALTSDGRDIHFISQTIMEKDSDYLHYMEGRDRSTKPLDRVPGPVYAGMHWSIDPKYLLDFRDQLGALGKNEVDNVQQEVERELGLDLEQDVLSIWTGELGILWTGAGDDQWGALGFVGVNDEGAAEDALQQVWSRTEGDERKDTDAGTLYRWGDEGVAKVWDGQLWLGVGGSRIEEVDEDAKGFRKSTEADAVADVINSSSSGIGFADLLAIVKMAREEPDAGEWLDRFSDVVDPLEAVTMRSELDGNVFVFTTTLHTTLDDAYYTLLERLIDHAIEEEGDSLFDDIVPRQAKCDAAAEHMIALMTTEMGQQDTPEVQQIAESIRSEVAMMCEAGSIDTQCVLASSTLAEVERCERKDEQPW